MSATEQGLSGGQGSWLSRPPLWSDTVNQMGPQGPQTDASRLRTALPGFSGPGALRLKAGGKVHVWEARSLMLASSLTRTETNDRFLAARTQPARGRGTLRCFGSAAARQEQPLSHEV